MGKPETLNVVARAIHTLDIWYLEVLTSASELSSLVVVIAKTFFSFTLLAQKKCKKKQRSVFARDNQNYRYRSVARDLPVYNIV